MKCVGCEADFAPKVWNQKYCTVACQEHIYNKNYNAKLDPSKYIRNGNCAKCARFARIRKNNWCESCLNRAKFGLARKPTRGICSSCGRGPLALAGTKCKSCQKYGVFRGVSGKVSHGEVLLREAVAKQYPNMRIEFNYKPDWLVRRGRLEIDVAVPDLKVGFEFDGRPHWDPKHPGFVKTLTNDAFKANSGSKAGRW